MAKEAKVPKEAKDTKAFKSPMEKLEEKYGKGTIQSFDDKSTFDRVEGISTGSIGLDRATGIGGFPKGRMSEIYGPEASGKTTIATHALISAQKTDPRDVLIEDVEHAFDFPYAIDLGLDPSRVKFCQPSFGEMAFDIAKELLKTGLYSACLFDGIAAAIPKEQHEGETGQSRMARLAALMSMELPKLVPIVSRANTAMIFTNQLRANVGGYGAPLQPAGGNAMKFYASIIMSVWKTAEKDKLRNKTTAKVEKNKCASPHQEAEFYVDWGIGVNQTNEILDMAIDQDIIKLNGSWYTMEDESKLQGDLAVLRFLNDNPEYLLDLKTRMLAKLDTDETEDRPDK